MEQTIFEMTDYFRYVFAKDRQKPKNNLITILNVAREQNSVFSEEQLLSTCVLLFFAGHETTMSLIGNSVLALLCHPDQLQKLEDNPSLIKTAVEECLRYYSPEMRHDRIAIRDLVIGGRQIRTGERIIAVLGAANRDPAQFSEPDRLDITRQENRHIAFGHGIHFCLGASLARCEAQIAVNTLLRRLPVFQLTSEKIQWRQHFSHRGLESLHIMFAAR